MVDEVLIERKENMMMNKFKVWGCKIVVANDAEMPDGFDFPPRNGAIKAIEANGVKVLSCFSGWGGTLTEIQTKIVEEIINKSSK